MFTIHLQKILTNFFKVISLIFFLISLQSHDLLSDAPLLTSMPSLITFFLLFFPFLSIYLHFLKKTGSLDFYDNDWMPRSRRTSWHPPLQATVGVVLERRSQKGITLGITVA